MSKVPAFHRITGLEEMVPRIQEQIVDLRVLHVMKESVEAVRSTSQEHIQSHAVEQIVNALVPRIGEEQLFQFVLSSSAQ